MKSPQRKVGLHIMTLFCERWVLIQAALIGLTVLSMTVLVRPLHSHHTPFNSKTMALRLAAIEEKNPYRLEELVRNGRPTFMSFIDHLCYTCLRSVEHVEQLKREFSGRANIIVIDPSCITTGHSWAKDRYQVWFVPKFVILDRRGHVAWKYFGPLPTEIVDPSSEASWLDKAGITALYSWPIALRLSNRIRTLWPVLHTSGSVGLEMLFLTVKQQHLSTVLLLECYTVA